MEIAVPDLAGSLGGGGRYDNLVGMFLGEDVPACGFSLGLERILVVMAERGMFPADVQQAAADVMVTLFDDGDDSEALGLAAELRPRRPARRGVSGARQARQADQVRGVARRSRLSRSWAATSSRAARSRSRILRPGNRNLCHGQRSPMR